MASLLRGLRRLVTGERRAIPRTPEARSIIHRQAMLQHRLRERGIRHGARLAQQRIAQQ